MSNISWKWNVEEYKQQTQDLCLHSAISVLTTVTTDIIAFRVVFYKAINKWKKPTIYTFKKLATSTLKI
jgi:hypothetical protein